MTEKLFYEDSYIKEFQARVLSCRERNGGYQAVLTRTAFFPEGGGQSADTGFLYTIIFPSLSRKERRSGENWIFRSVFQRCSSIRENISFRGW